MPVPQISVLMGVYYRRSDPSELERSVTSILNQSFSDFEFLICDDGSSPQAVSYLNQAAQQDSRIRLVREGRLISLSSKLNACLKLANGQWVARMDDDDRSHPQRFERQLAYLNSHPQVSFAGCSVDLYRRGQLVGTRRFPEFPSVRDFYFAQPYIHPTLIFRKTDLLSVNGYSERPSCLLCEDYDLLLRLYAAGYQGANMPDVLFDYTIPPTAKGSRKMSHRWNEAVTRYHRFKELKVLPQAWPYVLKPVAVGLVPEPVLSILKDRKNASDQ